MWEGLLPGVTPIVLNNRMNIGQKALPMGEGVSEKGKKWRYVTVD